MNILQINSADILGGAEKIAWILHNSYRKRSVHAKLLVGRKFGDDPDVCIIPTRKQRSGWVNFWQSLGDQLTPYVASVRGAWQLQTLLYGIGRPGWWWNTQQGYEDFDFPGTRHLLNLFPEKPDILHCHNLHGGYFDLRALPLLSQQLPTVITLHDMWLLTGHCAHSLDCERWKTGCGNCPYLSVYPPIARDGSAFNWQRKKKILEQSKLYVTAPSAWLMNLAKESILFSGMVENRVIPNGVDINVFCPVDKWAVREQLSVPVNAKVLLFVASSIRRNVWKDFQLIRAAMVRLAEHCQTDDLRFIALGEDAPAEQIGRVRIEFIPYQADPYLVARYYQAADIYLHAARADNFPTVILESLACGTPVVATAVGGIPEQIKSLRIPGVTTEGYDTEKATGVLVSSGNVEQMAAAIKYLLQNEVIRRRLGQNAAEDARQRFSLERMTNDYLAFYQEILQHWRANNSVN